MGVMTAVSKVISAGAPQRQRDLLQMPVGAHLVVRQCFKYSRSQVGGGQEPTFFVLDINLSRSVCQPWPDNPAEGSSSRRRQTLTFVAARARDKNTRTAGTL
jgi:hypothetical protein